MQGVDKRGLASPRPTQHLELTLEMEEIGKSEIGVER